MWNEKSYLKNSIGGGGGSVGMGMVGREETGEGGGVMTVWWNTLKHKYKYTDVWGVSKNKLILFNSFTPATFVKRK